MSAIVGLGKAATVWSGCVLVTVAVRDDNYLAAVIAFVFFSIVMIDTEFRR